ncbi:MAG: PHP domain-containing protein [Clostridiaceae bacterium]|nr:PHP domain-containing protein [Clostridiaceae bacterium]
MRYYIDLHIHSALSPCGDEDMTPNNIVNMAALKGLDFIAVTDHNAVGNTQAIMECAQDKGIIAVPGMEVQTSEEVHVLCLFPDLESAVEIENLVQRHLPAFKNRPDIFGPQVLYNSKDEVIGYEDKLLVTATALPIHRIKYEVEKVGGVAIPAHIDKNSFSIISNLGFIPDELGFTAVEVSKRVDKKEYARQNPGIEKYRILCNSDAHYLWDISEPDEFVELEEKTIVSLLKYLKGM